MAGNTRRSSRGKSGRPPLSGPWAGPGLRLERLEDRTVPTIVQQGIPNWVPQGPAPTENAQVPGVVNSPVTGAATALAAHPTNPNILFAAGVNGGVWRTTNAQAANPTWQPLTDRLATVSVGSMDLNPDTARQTLLVGSGANSSAAGISGDLIGLWITNNAFAPNPTFRVLNGGGLLINQTFHAVIARDGYLLAAGDNGVYTSLDGGNTWATVSGSSTLPAGKYTDAVADPLFPSRVYVGGPSGVFRTDDITAPAPLWINVTDPQMNVAGVSDPFRGNLKIAVHSTASNNVVWVATAGPLAGTAASQVQVVWSTNGGVSWTAMDEATNLGSPGPISDATNASPIQITSANHGLQTGDRVFIQGVRGNLGANGLWTITVTGANTFTLNGSTGTGIYSGGGTWQKVYGTNPGGQSSIHMALAADPADPNLVYLSGDRQDAIGPRNGVGAQDFSGNVMRGDRSQPRGFNAFVPSPQWVALTDNNAANHSAPHADSRRLIFDAAGNLLEGDDGGVYKRTQPSSPNLTAGGWFSENGDTTVAPALSLGQFVKVQLDTVQVDAAGNPNPVLFGGTQDTGSIEQVSGVNTDNQIWTTAVGGDGNWQGVDNTQKVALNQSIRYSIGNALDGVFIRRQYDNKNNQLSQSLVLLASPKNPNTPFDGLDGSDKGQGNSGFDSRFSLNAIDGRLMMLGYHKLYEDNDPDPLLGQAGDVIANITPAGYAGITTAISYGGRQNGLQIPRIAWVGTSAGQVWVRGAAGGFAEVDANMPGGTGGVDSLVVDPDDWRTAYVLRNNKQIFKTSDAGATWTDISENLPAGSFDQAGNAVGGLTTAVYSLALWDSTPGSSSGATVLLASGRGGVFRYVPGVVDPNIAGGNWIEYGLGLPNTVVSDVEVYGNYVIAATQGRGAWIIQDPSTGAFDASSTITAKATVQVIGTAGPDNMSLIADPTNAADILVSDGTTTVRVERTAVQSFEFKGLGGADTITLQGNGNPGGDLSFIRFPVTIDAGGDPGDQIVVRDSGLTAPVRATVTASTIGADPADNLFSGLPGTLVNYTGVQQGTLTLDLGTGRVGNNAVYVRSTSALNTVLVGTNASDYFELNGNAGTGNPNGDLSGITGAVTVNGRAGAGDKLAVSDFGAGVGNDSVTIAGGVITGFAGPTDGSSIFYGNIDNLSVYGSNNNQLTETFTVQDPSAALALSTSDGPDAVNLQAAHLAVGIDGGAGNDVIRLSSVAGVSDDGDLSGITGTVNVDGGPGDNRLIVSNFGSPNGGNVTIGNNQIVGATAQPIGYAATGGRFFDGAGDGFLYRGSNAATDNFVIASTQAGDETAVDGDGGNDTFGVAADSLAGSVWLRGGVGDDQFGVNGGVFGVTADSLRLSGGGGRDSGLITGFDGNENAAVTVTDPTGGRFTGLGNPLTFDTLGLFEYDGMGGKNNLTVTNASGSGLGSVTDPSGGVVYKSAADGTGQVTIANGNVGPIIAFRDVNGSDTGGLVINGSGDGSQRGTLTVLGISDTGHGTALGDFTAASGADNIFVSDADVTIQNASLGFLRTVAIGRGANGRPTFQNLYVFTGNQVGQGDTVDVLPSNQMNIVVDGGQRSRGAGGSTINSATTAPHTVTRSTDPNLGPPQTRVVFDDGSSYGFINFPNAAAARRIFAVGADAGGGPRVQVFDADSQAILFDGFVFPAAFTGGVRVATGDVTGDGVPDVVVAAGPAGGPMVIVLDGVTFDPVSAWFAYAPNFTGGVYVAVGDLNGDGVDEIITGAGLGGAPLVRTFNASGIDQGSFFAYDPNFRGGVRVAAGDLDGDGVAEVVTGAGPGGGAVVNAFDIGPVRPVGSFLTMDPNYRGGVFVAAGDLTGDGKAEVVTAPGGDDVAPAISVLRSDTGELVSLSVFDVGVFNSPEPLPNVPPEVLSASGNPNQQAAGIRVAVGQENGKAVVLASRGFGFTARVHAYTIDPPNEEFNIVPMDGWAGGVFVG